jgi:hypothetical protein
MQYPTLPLEVAKQGLEKHRAGEPWSGSAYVRWAGSGPKFDEATAAMVLSQLRALREQIATEPLPAMRGKDFESPACAIVHSGLPIGPAAAGSREFWLWINFVAADGGFLSLVDWRFSAREAINEVNYGITRRAGVWEGLLARLWWRGSVGYNPDEADPYRLARKGDVDIWRSHIIRQEYGRFRPLARALIEYQNPDKGKAPLSTEQLRALAKRLRIVDASISYELLSPDQLKEIIKKNGDIIKAG